MIPNNYQKLIDKLIDKTQRNQAIWDKTSRENEYKLELGKGSITVDNWEHEFEMHVDINLRNDRGDIVDSISRTKGTVDYDSIMQLHTVAKKSFYKVDETIDSIFKELDSDKIIGKRGSDDLPF